MNIAVFKDKQTKKAGSSKLKVGFACRPCAPKRSCKFYRRLEAPTEGAGFCKVKWTNGQLDKWTNNPPLLLKQNLPEHPTPLNSTDTQITKEPNIKEPNTL